jgi:hypothetical protein
MSFIEDQIDGAIDRAFTGGVPRELRRQSLPVRLALARALDLLPAEIIEAIRVLASIRNVFAHSFADELTERQADDLAVAITPLLKDDVMGADYEGEGDSLLVIAVGTVILAVDYSIEHALEVRKDAFAKAGRPRTLSLDDIRSLVALQPDDPELPDAPA